MRLLRALGVIFLIVGLAALGADVEAWLGGEPFRMAALGEWWFAIHRDSLQILQPAVERHLSPALWDPGIQTLLEWPLAIQALLLGAVFLVLGRPWRKRRRR